MKNLVLSSLLILILNGCSFNVFNGYHKIEKRALGKNELKSIFYGDTNSFVFKTKINLFKNYFSGLMVIKLMPEKSYRVIFITEMGLKVFDIEFFNAGNTSTENDFKLYYCMDALNKKIIISALRNDIGLMLMNHIQAGHVKVLNDKNDSCTIFKIKNKCKRNYYFYNVKTNKVSQIIQSSGLLKKVAINFYNLPMNIPDSIGISHYNIKFNMQLNLLPKN